MTDALPEITLKAIGIVRNGVKRPQEHDWEGVISDIVVDESLTEALDGLEEFSHIKVLYWMHKVSTDAPPPLKIHPRRRKELPLMGLFATRSPKRPNSIGVATVKLINRNGNILTVEGLDAINGSPVIDIKPYIPGYDSADDARAPSWVTNPHG